jgi:flagellar biosynthesis protein FlhG
MLETTSAAVRPGSPASRPAPRAERALPSPTIWAVASGKGGVGKSVFSASLAIGLAQSGPRAVAVDLDLGGANLHTLFGCARAPHTLADFALGKLKSIREALTSTTVPGVRMLSGARAALDFANAPHAQKQKILRGLARIDASHVVLDLGAGSSFCTLDAFVAADRRILVVTPEPTAIENAYYFLKAAFFRSLRDIAREPEVRAALASVLDGARRSGATPRELVEAASHADERVGARLRARIRAFEVDIVVNRSDGSGDPGARIAAAGRTQLGANLRHAGSLAEDPSVPVSVARGVPVMQLFPGSRYSTGVQALVATLLAGEPTTTARALAPAATPSPARASDERRAPSWDLPLEQRDAAPGRALRARREQLGIDLALLHDRTRISRRVLEAIEAERYAELPPEVIAREYVRQIAVALHIPDPEQHAQSFARKARESRSAVGIASAVSRVVNAAPAPRAIPSPEELLAGFDAELETLEPAAELHAPSR